jgi:hypothetical protein
VVPGNMRRLQERRLGIGGDSFLSYREQYPVLLTLMGYLVWPCFHEVTKFSPVKILVVQNT